VVGQVIVNRSLSLLNTTEAQNRPGSNNPSIICMLWVKSYAISVYLPFFRKSLL